MVEDHAAPAHEPTATHRTIEETIDGWFAESFHGSVVARSTETWNHVHAAVEALKRRLAAAIADVEAHL